MNPEAVFEIRFCHSILRREPDNLMVMEMLAHFYTREGFIDEGLALDRKIVGLAPDNPVAHYNLACSLALKNRPAEAVCALRTAIEQGYTDFPWLKKDPDLQSLHPYPPFSALIAEFDHPQQVD